VHVILPAPSRSVAAVQARGNARIRALARLGKPIFCGGHHGQALALTFDDGPGPYTHLALRKLAAAHQRATFFIVGRSTRYYPGYLRPELRVAALADHTYSHADLAVLPRSRVYAEIASARALITRQSGQPVDLFRPPYGALSRTVLRVAHQLGLLTVMWTQDSGDSLGASYAEIIRNVERALRPGAIILMHENRGQTIRALTTLLPMLRRRHLRSVSLPELLASDPPSVTQVRRGSAACGRVRVSAGSD
jgi:peptidoglycan/xylan/chitin deacetylase (PgdA/CDA1 family)